MTLISNKLSESREKTYGKAIKELQSNDEQQMMRSAFEERPHDTRGGRRDCKTTTSKMEAVTRPLVIMF